MSSFSKLLLGASLFSLFSLSLAAPHIRRQDNGTRYLFSFGASYSQSGFDINSDQPAVGNPTGNPAIGSDTYSDGPVFPELLATSYNNSFTQLYDFAVGGATTTRDIVSPADDSVPTFEDQVTTLYEPKYSTPGGEVPWNGYNAFFTVQFGINDMTLSYQTADLSTEIPDLLEKYTSLLDNLYSTGARKFMIMGIPPLDRSPAIADNPDADPEAWDAAANEYNGQLVTAVSDWATANSDASLQIFGSHAWLTDVLDNPTEYGFQDATCQGDGTSNCVWNAADNFHLTSTAQNLMAQAMLEPLGALGW